MAEEEGEGNPSIDCALYENINFVYMGFAPCWVVLLAMWLYGAFYKYPAEANGLHRVLTALPVIESVYTVLSIVYYSSCPWQDVGSRIGAAVLLMVVILKEPLTMICLLLVAKGWCITRDAVSNHENRVLVASGAFLYVCVIVQLFGAASGTRPVALGPGSPTRD